MPEQENASPSFPARVSSVLTLLREEASTIMAAKNDFNAARDIPDLSGKVILVTGGNITLFQSTSLIVS